jgi:uncharacterized protein with HEPN domain
LSSRKVLGWLDDIVKNCDRIARHVEGLSAEAYLVDEKTVDAVERCLQRISEAAYRLDSYVDELYPEAPWKEARGIGNVLRHKYDTLSDDLIWASIEADLPRLRKSALQEIDRLQSS